MTIESKFDVHNLVKRKFDTNANDVVQALEVMEISSQTCYAGTQIFYQCKNVLCQKQFKNEYQKTGEFKWVIGHGVNKIEDGKLAWMKYREDELIPCPQNEIDLITGAVADLV